MYITLIVVSLIVLLCIFLNKALYRFGVPSLLVFLVLGMLMGSDGIGGIYFDNFDIAEEVSYFALVFIMFYGGFGTKWDTAKPVAVKAGIMSSLGTVITAVVIGFFCSIIFGVPFLYGLLFGSIVGSTDAASVFSILRSRKLNLKNGLAPLLELESGSNDPFAYMMTTLTISVIQVQGEDMGVFSIVGTIAAQIGIAVTIGTVIAVATVFVLKHLNLEVDGFYPILIFAIIILSFSLCSMIGGNGFLCVYILGIIVGNSSFFNKISTVNFFDSISWIMQIMLFFILGLLSFPSHLPSVAIPGIIISVLLIVAARPLATFSILSWFRVPFKDQILVSWVGLRGAASIVFAVVAIKAFGDGLPYDLFHLVFFVALFSVMIQGTLMPLIANKLDLVDKDDENAVMKTFTDYFDETNTNLSEYRITKSDRFWGKCIAQADIPENILILLIKRGDGIILPKGSTEFMEDDILVMSGDGQLSMQN
ncbi:MAG: potassium/proton antiporter [Oscillospiraceae bacterium]|nr:potassium/proton antiporter [Oscillospiraceae bacterium]